VYEIVAFEFDEKIKAVYVFMCVLTCKIQTLWHLLQTKLLTEILSKMLVLNRKKLVKIGTAIHRFSNVMTALILSYWRHVEIPTGELL